METILINGNDRTNMELLLTLANKLGLTTRKLTRAETEDWNLAKEIEDAMKSGDADRDDVMKALGN